MLAGSGVWFCYSRGMLDWYVPASDSRWDSMDIWAYGCATGPSHTLGVQVKVVAYAAVQAPSCLARAQWHLQQQACSSAVGACICVRLGLGEVCVLQLWTYTECQIGMHLNCSGAAW
jgi:hypothetical protein